ncbi:hypothetical protein QSV34_03470 [Porticoccus sp. W117]|uniref:hypothetical protein n=1 Tax=Porticoccus sp. W117 TaxID=3054777 RepID=UPI002591D4C3|nr:hypothetical protein [Porticoccus sp. W117]MDM3870410.1 hypothetical protein [Porticoccus sp. W117]
MNEEVIRAQGGKIIVLADDLAEIIVSEGVEVSAAMVDNCERILRERFHCPCRVLISRQHSYHYTFEAQQRLADLQCVHSVAILSNSPSGEITARIVRLFPGKGSWKVNFFADRKSALAWLEERKASQQE